MIARHGWISGAGKRPTAQAAAGLPALLESGPMSNARPAPVPPSAEGVEDGLVWTRFDPASDPVGGVVILHGAGSRRENHFDVARAHAGAGLSAICFDQRGHGASDGPMDGRIVDDVATIARLFGDLPLGLRGSSMGGWVALSAAAPCNARALMVICPTTAAQFGEGVRSGRLDFEVDREAVNTVLDAGDPPPPTVPTLLMHASGDEVVPVARSRELAPLLSDPGSRYVEVPGGHHRSLQHDPEFVELGVRFLLRGLTAQ